MNPHDYYKSARFAGLVLAAHSSVYMYDVNTSISYTPYHQAGMPDRYGGLIAGAYDVDVHLDRGVMKDVSIASQC